MQDKIFNVAIIGYGGMGGWHKDTLCRIPGMQVLGIYDIDSERQALARSQGLAVYSSLEELWADPLVDLITIATPNDSHLPLVVQSLEAGKHVLCEKPVALNSQELETMIQTAERMGKIFSIHQNRRWDEDFLVVKQITQENALGRIFNIESRVHGSRGIPGDWRTKKMHGGGMVLDWGVHLFDQMLQIMKAYPLKSLYAQLFYVTCGEVDDGFRVTFNFDQDITWLVEVGTSNFISMPRWYVQGSNGSAIIENWQRDGKIVMVSDWEKRDAIPVVTAAGLTKTMAPRSEDTIQQYPLPDVTADIRELYQNMQASIQEGAALRIQPQEVLMVMRLIDAIFSSAQKNQVIKLDDSFQIID